MTIIEDPNKPNEVKQEERRPLEQRRFYLTGLALLAAGVLFLVDRSTDYDIPFPLFSWEFILIIAGIYIGEKVVSPDLAGLHVLQSVLIF